MITFKEAFDRLTTAYINGEVNAYDIQFCFCGNLENNTREWVVVKIQGFKSSYISSSCINYTGIDYEEMERAFMAPISYLLTSRGFRHGAEKQYWIKVYNQGDRIDPKYEEALWKGFNDALEILKQIHKARGEDVDMSISMPKREKLPVKI